MTDRNRQCPTCFVRLNLGYRQVTNGVEDDCQEVWFCPRCKYQEFGDFVDCIIHIENEFSLVIDWRSGVPTIQEIGAVRLLDPDLKYQSLSMVIAQLKAKPEWKIGGLRKHRLDDLRQLADQLKLNYHIE
jgi:hypothetical protein